jgi:hypothetical protein
MKIQVKACRPGNAARILAKIGGEQTAWVIGGGLMQVNRGASGVDLACGSEFIREK